MQFLISFLQLFIGFQGFLHLVTCFLYFFPQAFLLNTCFVSQTFLFDVGFSISFSVLRLFYKFFIVSLQLCHSFQNLLKSWRVTASSGGCRLPIVPHIFGSSSQSVSLKVEVGIFYLHHGGRHFVLAAKFFFIVLS